MNYLNVAETAKRWGISERSVRNYCAHGRVRGARLEGKTWLIPADTPKPPRQTRRSAGAESLLNTLDRERRSRLSGGIYHHVQIELTYNSNHIEGSRLTHEQTRFIYETNTIGIEEQPVSVDDILETTNHFRCIDTVIEQARACLSQSLVKQLHAQLKGGTSDSKKSWFNVGDYKRLPNEVGGRKTAKPEDVPALMAELIKSYEQTGAKTVDDIIAFHAQFESIHPFQDGNGRVGRLIMFKECLRHDIVPFIITDDLELFYYRGLHEWNREPGYLIDTCLTAQDRFREVLRRFRIDGDARRAL